MLRFCAFFILLTVTLAIPKRRTTPTPVGEHINEDLLSNEWHPSDLSLFEEWMRGYPELGSSDDQKHSTDKQPDIVSATEPPPAFLADYEAQDFSEEGFGVQIKDDIPKISVGEYPGHEEAGTTDSKFDSDQHPKTDLVKGTSDVHSDTQTWFDSLADNPSKFDTENIASFRGIPGVNFPDYEEIPSTPFTCFDKQYLPGFYADMDAGCQVFHVCYDNRKVSFLCPVGTIFNQALLTCDYWQHSNCSRTPLHYNSNTGIGYNPQPAKQHDDNTNKYEKTPSNIYPPVDISKGTVPQVNTQETNYEDGESRKINRGTSDGNKGYQSSEETFRPHQEYPFTALRYLDLFLKFFPIKAKVSMFPENGQTKVKAVTSIGNSMRQRITVFPVANNSKIVAEAIIGEKRKRNRSQAGGYSSVAQTLGVQDIRKGKDIDQSVYNDVDDAFGIVRRVLEHVGRLLPRTTNVADREKTTYNTPVSRGSSCRCRIGTQNYQPGQTNRCRCYRPIPTLNPRFIVQPDLI